jgi:spore maturation protein CgeB
MSRKLSIAYFAHSWVSDWNHGNAHFLRGLVRELMRMGHRVRCYEQLGSWSLSNLVREEGTRAIEAVDDFRARFSELDIHFYNDDETLLPFLTNELRGVDVVIVHEWNDPHVINTALSLKEKYKFTALFHDTHHRAYSSPRDILRFHMHLFDGVLAFGEAIRKIYKDGFGIPQAWTFHEAADTSSFKPLVLQKQQDVVWIGNWGDDERTKELIEFLVGPASAPPRRRTVVHGVRYPDSAINLLADAGVEYRGYLPNLKAPEVYGQSMMTIHVPRKQYTNGLSGVPTIRVFETLACGIPLLCAPWTDTENLFRPNTDYLILPDGAAMKAEMEHLLRDEAARKQLAANGLDTITHHHTCAHRAEQLDDILAELGR